MGWQEDTLFCSSSQNSLWQRGLAAEAQCALVLWDGDEDWDRDWDVLGGQSQPHTPGPTWGLAAALLLPLCVCEQSHKAELGLVWGVGSIPAHLNALCPGNSEFQELFIPAAVCLQPFCWWQITWLILPGSSSSGIWGCSLSHIQEPTPTIPVGFHGNLWLFLQPPLLLFLIPAECGCSSPCLSQSCSSPSCCLRCPHCSQRAGAGWSSKSTACTSF